MKTSTRLNLLLASGCLGVADALVQLDFTRHAGGSPVNLAGRDSSELRLGEVFAFVVNASVGTPGQPVSLYVSPSDADTWVPDATSSSCDESYYDYYDEVVPNPTYCLLGAFNRSESSTYLEASQRLTSFKYSGADGSYGTGENGTDTLRVGGLELENFPMGLVSSSTHWVGVLGLGANRSYYSYAEYDNFPDRLVQTGKSKAKAYSIWLDDPAGASGSILFGAIDTSRYDGDLVRIDGDASYAHYGSFGVEVTGFNGSTDGSVAWNAIPFDATIGPAEVISNLPYDIASRMWQLSGATYNASVGAAVIPCDAADEKDDEGEVYTIQLAGSGGPVLKVHLSDLIIPADVTKTMDIRDYMGETSDVCLFGVQNVSFSGSSSTYDYYNLGSSMLRRTYAVFDIENSEVALAPAKFSGRSDPNVVEFASVGAPAPSATRYCGEGSSYSYYCDHYSSGYPTSTSGGPHYDDGATYPYGIGPVIGLSVAFGMVALIGLVASVIIWKRLCCGPRNKVGMGTGSDTDTEDAPAAVAGTALQGQRDSAMGPRQPLETIPESEMVQTSMTAPVLPPLPPRSVSPPSTSPGTQISTDQATAQPASTELEHNSREREVSELGESSIAGQDDNEHNEASPTALDKGKGRAVDTTDN